MGETAGGPDPGALREVEDRFIDCWGEVAAIWGVSPIHGRIHALLFLAPRPLDAETVRARLGISHGSCSIGLNDLVERGVVRRVNVPGSRRAKFAADPDGWKWLHSCVRERRRREGDPLLERVRGAAAFAEEAVRRAREGRTPGLRDLVEARDRVKAYARFAEEFAGLVDSFLALGGVPPRRLLRSFARAARPPKA